MALILAIQSEQMRGAKKKKEKKEQQNESYGMKFENS